MATLINGNLNSPIYAAQDADLLAAICGNTTCVTPVGEQFAETLEDANTIMVADGVIITKEGRRIQIDAGDIDEFLIPTGTQGQTQYFICGYHLYTDEDSAELCETFVEPVDSASEVITENTFRGGATEVYVSLLRVKQVGVQIDTITRLLPSSTTISQINSDLYNKLAKNGPIFFGVLYDGDLTTNNKQVVNGSGSSLYIGNTDLNQIFFQCHGTQITFIDLLTVKTRRLQHLFDHTVTFNSSGYVDINFDTNVEIVQVNGVAGNSLGTVQINRISGHTTWRIQSSTQAGKTINIDIVYYEY